MGTAPTSVMVITKFVYRRSWQANIINIKAFERDSIKIIKITEDMSKIDFIFNLKILSIYLEEKNSTVDEKIIILNEI